MWKKWLMFCCLPMAVMAQDPSPTSYPDVIEIPPPVVSLRNLNTGEPLRNGQYDERDEKNTHWQIVDIKVGNDFFVQFRAVGTNQCLTLAATTKDCGDIVLTALNLLSTDTGAFIISSTIDSACLFSNGFRQYDFSQCLRTSNPVDLPFLWAITPPFGKSKLLQVKP